MPWNTTPLPCSEENACVTGSESTLEGKETLWFTITDTGNRYPALQLAPFAGRSLSFCSSRKGSYHQIKQGLSGVRYGIQPWVCNCPHRSMQIKLQAGKIKGRQEVFTSCLHPRSQGHWIPHTCNTCKQEKKSLHKFVGWTTSYVHEVMLNTYLTTR